MAASTTQHDVMHMSQIDSGTSGLGSPLDTCLDQSRSNCAPAIELFNKATEPV
jgi:hypothetical protein